jgi:hypothetical protein
VRARLLFLPFFCALTLHAAEPAPRDAARPYRTDTANASLPWYQLKPGEFPPVGSEHRVEGALLDADYIHRRGLFRRADNGELADFTLPPYGTVRYLGADAELRDVPLGTRLQFFMYQDAGAAFTRAVVLQDDFTQLAEKGELFRVEELKLGEGKVRVVKQGLARNEKDLGGGELLVTDQTRVWKGDKPVKLADLAVGDDLLVNLVVDTADRAPRCADLYIGADAQKLATEQQRKAHGLFLRQRGLPAYIDKAEAKRITVTLLGTPADMQALFKAENIDSAQWVRDRRVVDTVVANEELRSYNPPVDGQRGPVLESLPAPADVYGCAGVRWLVEPGLMLEGFRRGRIVRVFAQGGWPVEDMPVGESLYTEMPGALTPTEEPLHYPYRTDFANADLPWQQLKPGAFPMYQSHHLVTGELIKSDPAQRTGRLRVDRTGEVVGFSLPPYAVVKRLNGYADLADLPPGQRCSFFMYQDEHGAFTRAAVVTDEYTRLSSARITFRVDAVNTGDKTLQLASMLAKVRNYKDDLVRPPDVGRGVFTVDDTTRIWKGDQPVKLADLAVGDEVIANAAGITAKDRGRLTDLWVGPDTMKLATENQRKSHAAAMQERGLPAWIDKVEGKQVVFTFFAGPEEDYRRLLFEGPVGGNFLVTSLDDRLAPTGGPEKMRYKSREVDGIDAGTYGSAGVRWTVDAEHPEAFKPGQIVRVFEESWPVKK